MRIAPPAVNHRSVAASLVLCYFLVLFLFTVVVTANKDFQKSMTVERRQSNNEFSPVFRRRLQRLRRQRYPHRHLCELQAETGSCGKTRPKFRPPADALRDLITNEGLPSGPRVIN